MEDDLTRTIRATLGVVLAPLLLGLIILFLRPWRPSCPVVMPSFAGMACFAVKLYRLPPRAWRPWR